MSEGHCTICLKPRHLCRPHEAADKVAFVERVLDRAYSELRRRDERITKRVWRELRRAAIDAAREEKT